MSKHWTERKVIYADNLWAMIDEWTQEIDRLSDNPEVKGSECGKMLLMGRREVVSWIADYLHEYEERLSELLEFWGVDFKEGKDHE